MRAIRMYTIAIMILVLSMLVEYMGINMWVYAFVLVVSMILSGDKK